MKRIVVALMACLLLSLSFAQSFKSYTVKPGDTLYSLAKASGVSQEDIKIANPELSNGLRSGQLIQIPIPAQKASVPNVKFENYKVKRKDSLYGIAKSYGITVDDIIKYNPWAEKGIKKKDILRIPDMQSGINKGDNTISLKPTENQKDKQKEIKYEVVAGDTMYSLSKRYNCTIDALLAQNPQLKDGLKTGMLLSIITNSNEQTDNAKEEKPEQRTHVVGTGDTLYNIAKRYNITVADIEKANPGVKAGSLVESQIIIIPFADSTTNVGQEEWTYQPAGCKDNKSAILKRYKVVVMLPFNASKFEDSEISASSKGFLQMYQGMLIAIDELKRQGAQLDVTVYDTRAKEERVKAIMEDDGFKQADIIIGPVYPHTQKLVANYAKENKVMMISPLSSAGNYEEQNPYFVKVNPTEDFLTTQTEVYLNEHFSSYNMIALNADDSEFLNSTEQDEMKAHFSGFHIFDVANQKANELQEILVEGKDSTAIKNVAYIPFNEETKVNQSVSVLYTAAEKYPITLLGLYSYPKFKSVQVEYFHKLNMNILSPYFVDYNNPKVDNFISKYRENYSIEPTQFSFQGYDVCSFFLSALTSYGSDFSDCIADFRCEKLLQGNFNFVKQSQSGGWMNQGLFVVEYEPDFKVRSNKLEL